MSALIKRNCIGNALKTIRFYCSKPELPRNILEEVISAHNQTKPGVIYDKKPFRIELVKGNEKNDLIQY